MSQAGALDRLPWSASAFSTLADAEDLKLEKHERFPTMSVFDTVFLSTLVTISVCFLSYFVLMVHFSRKPNGVAKKSIFPSVSMIIATYNEALVVSKKLSNTLEMEYPKDKLEILVVDSGSTDTTRKIVTDFAEQNKNRGTIQLLTQQERLGKANALNYALKHAVGDIVILTDADVLLDKDAILKVTSNFADGRIGAVSGIEVIRNPDQSHTTEVEQGYRSFYNTLRLGESNLDSVIMCESEFTAYRKNLMENLPPNSICDDMELTLRVRKKGFKAIYDPSIVFHECSPSIYGTRLKHKIRRGQGIQQTLMRFAGMMFRPKYGVFSFVILPFEFFMHLVSPILLPICIATGIVSIITAISSFNMLLVFLLVMVIILSSSLFIFILRRLSPAFSVTLKDSMNGASSRIVLVAFDFITLQMCLLVGLFSLALRGPNYKWDKIDGIRETNERINKE